MKKFLIHSVMLWVLLFIINTADAQVLKKLGGKAKQKIDDGDVKVKEADGTKTKIDADRDVKIRWNFV